MKRLLLVLLLPLCSSSLAAQDDDRLTVHGNPKPLPKDAKTEPWPAFLGVRWDGKSGETGIATTWEEKGPKLLWELQKGEGYTTPAIGDGKLILFHRLDGKEMIECRHPENGAEIWTVDYPVAYRDQYGYSSGPRGSPVIESGFVYTLGVRSMLTCCSLADGKIVWQRDLQKDYQVPQYFFGTGSSPVVWKETIIINVGGREPPAQDRETVIAFDKKSGETKWIAKTGWGASYATPIIATIHGKERLFVFAGGKSRPPEGGLLLLDPVDGKILDRFDWRAQKYESVNATTPVVVGNRVFITETYRLGGICLDIDENDKFQEAWRAPNFGTHWSQPIHHEGYLYGFHGEREPFAELVCYEWATGKERWRNDLRWQDEHEDGRKFINSPFRGSLLHVQGKYLCQGEGGTLLWLTLTPEGATIDQRFQLFHATQTWSAPAIHRGLVYLSQHYKDLRGQTGPRLLCYDFRAGNPVK